MDHQSILAWASGHLERAEGAITEYTGEYPYRVRSIRNPEKPTDYTVVLREWKATPPLALSPDAMLWVGDTVHTLRTSLDYLAFRLVPEPSRSAHVGQILFPICTNPGQYPDVEQRRLPQVSAPVLGLIKRLQPCFSRKRQSLHPLAVLNALENVHKHRRLLVGHLGMSSLRIWTTGRKRDLRILHQTTTLFPVKNKAEVAQFRLLRPLQREAQVHARGRFYLTFNEPGIAAHLPIIVTLKEIRDHLRDTIFPKLERFIT